MRDEIAEYLRRNVHCNTRDQHQQHEAVSAFNESPDPEKIYI